jgi:hypothetical protein
MAGPGPCHGRRVLQGESPQNRAIPDLRNPPRAGDFRQSGPSCAKIVQYYPEPLLNYAPRRVRAQNDPRPGSQPFSPTMTGTFLERIHRIHRMISIKGSGVQQASVGKAHDLGVRGFITALEKTYPDEKRWPPLPTPRKRR